MYEVAVCSVDLDSVKAGAYRVQGSAGEALHHSLDFVELENVWDRRVNFSAGTRMGSGPAMALGATTRPVPVNSE